MSDDKESRLRDSLELERWERAKTCANALEREEWGSEAYETAAFALWFAMSGAQRESLEQILFSGPVWDGDHISKSARDDLFKLGLATRCCYKGEQGYTAATYRAYTIFRASGQEKQRKLNQLREQRKAMAEIAADPIGLSKSDTIHDTIKAISALAPVPSPPDESSPQASETDAGVQIPEGFTPWSGGERPVPVGARVDLLLNDGNLIEASSAEIWDLVPIGQNYWNNTTKPTRIIAYRVVSLMAEHDHSPESPVPERAWIHFMSASGYSGGNGWSDEIDWTQVDLYEIRPEGPPDLSRYAGSEEVNLNSTAPVIDAEPEATAEPVELPTQLDSQAQEEGEPGEQIVEGLQQALDVASGEDQPARVVIVEQAQPQASSEQSDKDEDLAKLLAQGTLREIEAKEKAQPRFDPFAMFRREPA